MSDKQLAAVQNLLTTAVDPSDVFAQADDPLLAARSLVSNHAFSPRNAHV